MNPLSRWLLVVATFGLLTVPAHGASASETAPILWTGTIQAPSGSATPATVTAYLQPPVSTLRDEGAALSPIASTTADRDGHFVLRAPYDETAHAAADPAGWVSVLVVATTSDGTSMATDSVRFDEGRDRWSTHPAEAEAAGRFTAQSAEPATATFDRPAVLTLHKTAPRDRDHFEAAGSKPKICYMKKGGRDVGVTPVTVGELDLARNWGGEFNYTDTRTSTFEVGFKYEREGVWSAGGSASFSKDGTSQSINPVAVAGFPRHNFYRADMMFSTVRMDCGGRMAEELRPTMWTGGMRPEMAASALCDHRFEIPVAGGGGTFVRQDGSSQTFSAAFSIVGFSGGATSVNSNSVRHAWVNGDAHTRHLCGVTDFPSRDSRVISLP